MLLIPVPMLSQWRRVRDPGGRTIRRWISELLGYLKEQDSTDYLALFGATDRTVSIPLQRKLRRGCSWG